MSLFNLWLKSQQIQVKLGKWKKTILLNRKKIIPGNEIIMAHIVIITYIGCSPTASILGKSGCH